MRVILVMTDLGLGSGPVCEGEAARGKIASALALQKSQLAASGSFWYAAMSRFHLGSAVQVSLDSEIPPRGPSEARDCQHTPKVAMAKLQKLCMPSAVVSA